MAYIHFNGPLIPPFITDCVLNCCAFQIPSNYINIDVFYPLVRVN